MIQTRIPQFGWPTIRLRLIFSMFLRAQVRDRRGCVRAWRGGISRDVLLRSIGKHLVFFFPPASQRRRLLHLFTILVRISGESGLLSAWFWGNTCLVLILDCHLFLPFALCFDSPFSPQRPLQRDRRYQCCDDDHDNNGPENRRANHGDVFTRGGR